MRQDAAKGAEDVFRFPTLSDSHKRSITISLSLLDERLLEIEEIARGREVRSVFLHEVNRLTGSQRKKLLTEAARMREILTDLKETLGLEAKDVDLSKEVWAASNAFWEVLVETESKYMRRYGEIPAGLGKYLDPKIKELINGLAILSEIASCLLIVPGTIKCYIS